MMKLKSAAVVLAVIAAAFAAQTSDACRHGHCGGGAMPMPAPMYFAAPPQPMIISVSDRPLYPAPAPMMYEAPMTYQAPVMQQAPMVQAAPMVEMAPMQAPAYEAAPVEMAPMESEMPADSVEAVEPAIIDQAPIHEAPVYEAAPAEMAPMEVAPQVHAAPMVEQVQVQHHYAPAPAPMAYPVYSVPVFQPVQYFAPAPRRHHCPLGGCH